MIELSPVKHPSSSVHSIGYEPIDDRWGNAHVQFHKEGKLTVRGYYKDVPAILFRTLEDDRRPGKLINAEFRGRFDWVPVARAEYPEITYFLEHPDLTLPNPIIIPADVENTVDAVAAWTNAQRIPIQKEGLFK